MSVDCSVCIETVSNYIECSCGFIACVDCNKHWILSKITPQCMNCKAEFTMNDMYKHFTKSWVNSSKKGGFRAKQKETIVNTEKQRFPELLQKIENERKISKLYKEKRKLEKLKYSLLPKSFKDLPEYPHKIPKIKGIPRHKLQDVAKLKFITPCCYVDYVITKNSFKISTYLNSGFRSGSYKLRDWFRELPEVDPIEELYDLHLQIQAIKGEIAELGGTEKQDKSNQNNFQFICPCPKDDCNGMVKRYRKIESVDQDDDDESEEEVTDQKVGLYCCLCDQKVCFSCHEPRNKGHECDEDTVSTVKLLRKAYFLVAQTAV